MAIVFVARVCLKSNYLSVACESQRSAMDADGNEGVAVSFLQLRYDLRGFGTVCAALPGEVFEEHDALGRLRLLVYQTFVFRYSVAANQQQADATYNIVCISFWHCALCFRSCNCMKA